MQTRSVFAAEAAAIADRHRRLEWSAPSRDEGAEGSIVRVEPPTLTVPGLDVDEPVDGDGLDSVQGGRQRGLVIHKILEEVLTGEVGDDEEALTARARILIGMLGGRPDGREENGPQAAEIAACVIRTFKLPDIAALRETLQPEYPVLASSSDDGVERVTAGIADAVSFSAAGAPDVVVDWKSDVEPSVEAIARYPRPGQELPGGHGRRQRPDRLRDGGHHRPGIAASLTAGAGRVVVSPDHNQELVAWAPSGSFTPPTCISIRRCAASPCATPTWRSWSGRRRAAPSRARWTSASTRGWTPWSSPATSTTTTRRR